MNRIEVINQLKDLILDRKSFCAGDYDPTFDRDIEALEYAIVELETRNMKINLITNSNSIYISRKKSFWKKFYRKIFKV